MRPIFLVGWNSALLVVPFVALTAGLEAQTPSAVANQKGRGEARAVPRTAGGHPDFQGFWTNATLTPFERTRELATKEFFTENEAAAFEKRMLEVNDRDRRGATPEADVAQAYNEAWFERGTRVFPTRRTSIVVDPPDGRVPALMPLAQRAAADRTESQRSLPRGPEDMALPVRCLLWPTAGPPMVPGPYNNNYQIIQTPEYLAIDVEMIHDVRIIHLDGKPHISRNIRLWMGDSRGHWEGGTLVVDTTNFTDQTHYRGADRNLHLVERFTLSSPNTILYRFTIDDPTAFTKPWTGEIVMAKTKGPLYEYACHEGNYAMGNILRAARVAEKAGQSK